MTNKKNSKAEKLKEAQSVMLAEKVHKKHNVNKKNFKDYFLDQMPAFIRRNLIANLVLFLFGSAVWSYTAHTRTFDPDYDTPDGPRTGPYIEQRTYKKALKDAYMPIVKGKFVPDFDWYFTISMIVTFALFTLSKAAIAANNTRKKDLKNINSQIDIMLEIERMAKERNLDANAAKKILSVAPEIVKHMSADSRLFFDLILDGKIAIDDEKFIKTAIAIMAGHLQSHPKDMNLIMSALETQPLSNEILYALMQEQKQ